MNKLTNHNAGSSAGMNNGASSIQHNKVHNSNLETLRALFVSSAVNTSDRTMLGTANQQGQLPKLARAAL